MFWSTLAVYVLGSLLRTVLVHGAVIPGSADITTTSSLSDSNPVLCNDLEGFVGNGIVRSDCPAAINDFYSTTVRPHAGQEYEFLDRYVRQIYQLPSVVTPIKFHSGEYRHRLTSSSLNTYSQARASLSL